MKKYLRPIAALTSVLALTLTLSACRKEVIETGRIHVSSAKVYTDFTSLRSDSKAIIEATAGPSRPSSLNGVATTVTAVSVTQVLSGSVSAKTIYLRQLGTEAVKSPETSRLLTEGNSYLMFVRPLGITTDQATDEYSLTSNNSLYRLDGTDYVFEGPSGAALTERIPAATAQRTFRS